MATQTPFGRLYRHPLTGEEFYSVTTILEHGIPKPGLVSWAAKAAAQYAYNHREWLAEADEAQAIDLISTAHERLRDEAAARGDTIHEEAETYANGGQVNSPSSVQLREFLNTSGWAISDTEITLLSRAYRYAGTADALALTPAGHYILLDYKSGKSVWPEAMLQVEALARCSSILAPDGLERPLPPINGVAVLHLRPRSWWLHLNDDRQSRHNNWLAFNSAKRIADWRRTHPSQVFGPRERMNAQNWAA